MQNIMEVPQNIKNGTFIPAIPPLGIYLKKRKPLMWKDTIAALFAKAKIWKNLKCWSSLMDEKMKKMRP